MIAALACEQTARNSSTRIIADGFFDRVILISAAMDPKSRLLKQVARCTANGIFNYFSTRDTIFRSLEYRAAGEVGYNDRHADREYITRQLDYDPGEADSLGNHGHHMEAYEKDYFDRYFIPLIKGHIPKGWE